MECNVTNIINSSSISDGCTLSSGGFIASGETLNLNGSTSGVISFSANNIILDLNGTTLVGNGSTSTYAIFKAAIRGNITIKNGFLVGYGRGYSGSGGASITLQNMTIVNYTSAGILTQSNTLIVNSSFRNDVSSTAYGISITSGGENNTIETNTFINTRGVTVTGSSNLIINGNNISTIGRTFATYILGGSNNISFINNKFYNGVNNVEFEAITNAFLLGNLFNNNTQAYAYYFKDSQNITSDGDRFNLLSKAYDIQNTTGFLVNNSWINDTTTSYDGWDLGFSIHRNSSGIINNATISNTERAGIVIRNNNLEVNVSNVYINHLSNSQKLSKGDTTLYWYPPVAIVIGQTYIGFPDLAAANTDTYLNISNQGVSNVNLASITFGSNVQIMMTLQGTSGITWDNSLSDSWYRKLSFPNYLYQDPTEYFISNNYENVTSTYNLALNDLLGISYNNVYKARFKLYKSYTFLNNTMTTANESTFFNLTSALIFYSNNSLIGGGLVTGDVNISLGNSTSSFNAVCANDNFILTETNDGTTCVPFTISNVWLHNKDRYDVTSTLVSSVDVPVTLGVSQCDNLGKISTNSQTWNRGEYTCTNNLVTISSATLVSGTTRFSIDYGCDGFTLIGYKIIALIIAMITPFSVLLYIRKEGWENLEFKHIVMMFIAIIFGASLYLSSGQLLGGSCGPIAT